jgi:hypothetical protein
MSMFIFELHSLSSAEKSHFYIFFLNFFFIFFNDLYNKNEIKILV